MRWIVGATFLVRSTAYTYTAWIVPLQNRLLHNIQRSSSGGDKTQPHVTSVQESPDLSLLLLFLRFLCRFNQFTRYHFCTCDPILGTVLLMMLYILNV